jgi:hypothetical protein
VLLTINSAAWAADADKDKPDVEKRIDNAVKVLDEIMATPDKAIPDKIMDGECPRRHLVFPAFSSPPRGF